MKTKWPPDAGTVLEGVAPLVALLRPALEAGSDHAVRYFEERMQPIDPWLHSHIVRHYVKPRLVGDGLSDLGFRPVNIALSGLYFQSENYSVRILKVDHHRSDPDTGLPGHEIPSPATSETRREFFLQPALIVDMDSLEALQIPQRLKLVMLWDVDSLYQLTGLELVCPRRWDATNNRVYAHWWVPIPDQRVEAIASEAQQGVREVLEDLHILRLREEPTGTDGDGDSSG